MVPAYIAGYRLNIAGMAAAADLMDQHRSQARVTYAAALRLRLDVGSRRVLKMINGTLSAEAWRIIHRAAMTPATTRELRSCSGSRKPGSAAGGHPITLWVMALQARVRSSWVR